MRQEPQHVRTPVTDFPTIPRRSVTMDAAALIKDMILDGRLHPGHRLPSERMLSEALGVSRPSIREAIRSLVAMHILETRHGSGTYVSSLSLDELLRPLQFVVTLADSGMSDLFDVRELIEPGGAELAAQRATDEELEQIHRGASESTAPGLTHDERAARDIEWHDLIVRSSHNGLLINVHQSISLLSVESRAITIRVPGVAEQAVEDHRRIAKAICARKPAAARRAMHRHLENVRESLFAAVEAKELASEEDGSPASTPAPAPPLRPAPGAPATPRRRPPSSRR